MAVHSTRERPTSPRRNLSTAVGLSSGLAWVCRRAGGANGDAKLAPKLVLQGLDFGPKTLTCDQWAKGHSRTKVNVIEGHKFVKGRTNQENT